MSQVELQSMTGVQFHINEVRCAVYICFSAHGYMPNATCSAENTCGDELESAKRGQSHFSSFALDRECCRGNIDRCQNIEKELFPCKKARIFVLPSQCLANCKQIHRFVTWHTCMHAVEREKWVPIGTCWYTSS